MRLENAFVLGLLTTILTPSACSQREREKPIAGINVRWAFVNRNDCATNHIVNVEVRAHRSGNDTLTRRAPCIDGSLLLPIEKVPNIAGEWTVRVTPLDASDQRDCFLEVEERVTVLEQEVSELRVPIHTNSDNQICDQFSPDIDGGPLFDGGVEGDAGGDAGDAQDAGGAKDAGGDCESEQYDPVAGCPSGYLLCKMKTGVCFTFDACGDCCDGMCVEQ